VHYGMEEAGGRTLVGDNVSGVEHGDEEELGVAGLRAGAWREISVRNITVVRRYGGGSFRSATRGRQEGNGASMGTATQPRRLQWRARSARRNIVVGSSDVSPCHAGVFCFHTRPGMPICG
jgi:hypothetical protein